MKASGRTSAFTLIELLVVIAIISLLLATLMPALAKAKEHAISVKCLAQLKGVGTGMNMYTGEFITFPPCFLNCEANPRPPGVTYSNAMWPQLLMPFVGDNPAAVLCSAYPAFEKSQLDVKTNNYYACFAGGASGNGAPRYGYNHRVLGCGGYGGGSGCWSYDGSRAVKVSPDQVVRPHNLVMCYDNAQFLGNPICLYPSAMEWARNLYFPAMVQHLEGINMLFADGHAEWAHIDSDYFWDDTDHWYNN